MAIPTYNQVIRKIVMAFGEMFSNITLVRYTQSLVEQERFLVPIAYASKENYVMRLEGDPNLDKKVLMTLPRISYDLINVKYDPARKLNTNVRNFAQLPGGTISQYNPVPYNYDFELCIYVRNIEDGNQIVEHILPFFSPDYTIAINMVPLMNDVRNIPVTLNDTHYDVSYEGNRDSDPRMVIWTLSFTAKGFMYGPINGNLNAGIIYNSIINIDSIQNGSTLGFYMANTGFGSTYQAGEMVYQGILGLNTATGTVVSFINNKLIVSEISGTFTLNSPIVGLISGTTRNFTSFEVLPIQYAQIITSPVATDANSNSVIGFTTTINEAPNIANTIITTTDFSGDVLFEYGVDDLLTEPENDIDLGQ